MAKVQKRERTQLFPYIPGQAAWADVPWDKARKLDPRVDGFIGHNSTHFVFQVTGVCEVLVAK
jgi:hypothetical protein